MAAFSLGYVTVSTPGTPIRLTNNQSDPAKNVACGSIMVQALSTNVGAVYVGLSNLDKSIGTGVLAVLAIPTANSIPAFSMGNPTAMAAFDAAQIYIDSTSSVNGVVASYTR